MQKLCTIFLITLLSFQLVAKLGIVALYEINKEYIAKNLCENRAKPKMHCNGKCYLKKQLKKAEDRERSDNSTSKLETVMLTVFIVPSLAHSRLIFDDVPVLQHNSIYRSISGRSALNGIFHPPQYSC